MKVVAKTSDRLTVENRPWFVSGGTWMLGLAALLGSVLADDMALFERLLVFALGAGVCGVAWRLMPFTALDFDRTAGTLVVSHARITGATQNQFNIADIERALVQYDRTDSSNLERLVLKTKTGIKPIEFGFFSMPRGDIMQEINVWLDGT